VSSLAKILPLGVVAVTFLLVGCGKEKTAPEVEPVKLLLGRWTAVKRYKNEVGDKVEEKIYLIFRQSGNLNNYSWTYTVYVNDKEDTSKRYEESGTFTATETEITFVPAGGSPRTLSYKFLGGSPEESKADMQLTDESGYVWSFYYTRPW